MQTNTTVQQYLQQLELYLSRLSHQERNDVLREIESHLFDVLETQPETDIHTVLQGFGSPRELAAHYVAHLTTGAPLPTGFKAMTKVKRGVTYSLYFSMAVFGGVIAISLFITALAKLFWPEHVGVWSESAGEAVTLGIMADPKPAELEVLGFALVPVAAIASLAVFWLTRKVLQVLKKQL
ncbi:hypothetical protein [Rheinheimera sp.]|uniref:HAAS signaling domain-containing protein n=1 Tax=Rheinheimera sp. TaxID=1869214 RepID=UPI00307FB5A1